MILITLTKPRKKIKMLIQIAIMVLVVGVLVPVLYLFLTNAGSMSQFVAKEDGIPGEPIRVTVPPQEGFVDNIWMEEFLQVMGEEKSVKE